MNAVLTSLTTGVGGAGLSFIPTYPAGYTADSRLVLLLSTNNAVATIGVSGGATAIAPITSAGARLTAYEITPNGLGQANFGVAITPSSFYQWAVLRIDGAPAGSIVGAANNLGSNSTAPIAIPTIASLPRTTDGSELKAWAAAVNATGTWTAQPTSIYTSNTIANAAMQVCAAVLAAGLTSVVNTDLNRGLAGTTRNESALALAIFPPLDSGITFDHAGNPISVYGAGGTPLVASAA